MDIDYNEKHWAKPCPKVNCRKDACECGLYSKFIPAALGDDSPESKVAPKNGAYRNSIVKYEANGAVYLYGADGVPVNVKEGA